MKTLITKVEDSLLQSDVLLHLWQRLVQNQPVSRYSWQEETAFLHKIGLGMEEVIRILLIDRPSLLEFENWVLAHDLGFSNAGELQTILAEQEGKSSDSSEVVFIPEEIDFWEKNGYIVLKNAVPKSQAAAATEAIWQYLEASLEDETSWYKPHPDRWGIMLNFVHHPALRENRNSRRIERAFQQLYGTNQIEIVVDKVGYNPPNDGLRPFLGSGLHWDTSLVPPISKHLQGLLYLTDTGATDGAFHCVPGFHLKIEEWLSELPVDTNPRDFALKTLQPIPVPGQAGDLVIWRAALPHCATPNLGRTPRMVQYLTYLPKEKEPDKAWL